MVSKEIVFFGEKVLLCCDGKCNKAWGINGRQRVGDPDDDIYVKDSELGIAPVDPGTYEGGEGKPFSDTCESAEGMNKWCTRECERSAIVALDEDNLILPDLD